MINFRVISYFQGIILVFESLVIFLAGLVSFLYKENDAALIISSSFIIGFLGIFLWAIFMNCDKSIGKKEGYLIVALCWITCSLFGTIPYYFTIETMSFTDAFFESTSGFTTTGATTIRNIEMLPHGILFWRSMTQWLGGIGIIILSISVMPLLGVGGMNLQMLDITGQPVDKLHPRLIVTVKRLMVIYTSITLLLAILLIIGKMPVFDSICHAFTTVSTGGFSTKQANIAFYNSAYIQYVLIIFMIIAGSSFMLSYYAMHLDFKKIWGDEEFRAYISFITFFTIVLCIIQFSSLQSQFNEKTFRDALFQVSSIISTTGFVTTNFLIWPQSAIAAIALMMLLGSSSYSAGGGIKVVRILVLLKNGVNELKRLIHPNAIIPLRIDRDSVRTDVITNVLAFISIYILILVFGVITITFLSYDFETAVGSVLATVGNVGPGIGDFGPFSNYSQFNVAGKWFLSFLMILGRLELLTIIVIISPAFWRK